MNVFWLTYLFALGYVCPVCTFAYSERVVSEVERSSFDYLNSWNNRKQWDFDNECCDTQDGGDCTGEGC